MSTYKDVPNKLKSGIPQIATFASSSCLFSVLLSLLIKTACTLNRSYSTVLPLLLPVVRFTLPDQKNQARQLLNYFINFNLIQLITFFQALPAPRSSRLEVPLDGKCHCGRPCVSSGVLKQGGKKIRATPPLLNQLFLSPDQTKTPFPLLFCNYSAWCSVQFCALTALKQLQLLLASLTPFDLGQPRAAAGRVGAASRPCLLSEHTGGESVLRGQNVSGQSAEDDSKIVARKHAAPAHC